MRQSFKQLIGYLLPYKIQFGFVCIIVVIANILSLRIPYITGQMVDAIGLGTGKVDFDFIMKGSISILAIAAFTWALSVVQNLLMLKTAQSVVLDLRHDVFSRLLRLPVAYFDGTTKGNIISIISTDIDNISETVSADVITLLTGGVTVVSALGFMLEISGWMTCIFIVTVPMMFISAKFISRKSRVLFRRKKIDYGELCGYAEEMITAQKTVKVYGIEEYNKENFFGISGRLKQSGSKAETMSSMLMPSMNAINNLNFTLICIIGTILVLKGELSIGSISTFVLYSKRFAGPIIDTANVMNMFQVALAACDRVFGILNHEVEKDEPTLSLEMCKPIQEVKGEVVFQDVSFTYDGASEVLKHINLTIKPGEKIAIVGATGSGKTTLISLLMRFYDVTEGCIQIDGVDIRQMPLDYLRQHFAMVLQESWLFGGSIYENISYGIKTEGIDKERIQALCEEIGVDEFISALPNGYDTLLTGDLGSLSAGQKQLINIARTFMCNPPLYILDEATSSVDPLTEIKIKEVTDKVTKGKTSFIIAHRLSTILEADRILVMKDGQIVEQGNHEELLTQGGLYKELYESQFISDIQEDG